MVMNGSPLGQYAELAALIGAWAVLGVWLLSFTSLGIVARADALDIAGAGALGILLGQRATTNGAAKIASAAHSRLDEMGAPPAGANGAPR